MLEKKFFIFFTVWVILGILDSMFFVLNKNSKLKKRLHPWIVLGTAVLFIAFVIWISGFEIHLFTLLIIATTVMMFLNIKLTRFCDSCGKTLFPNLISWKIEFCPKCGAKLNS